MRSMSRRPTRHHRPVEAGPPQTMDSDDAITGRVACVIASIADVGESAARLTLIGLLAMAMGGPNAVVRRLAVPDLTTTVLTLTVTGLVADSTPRSARTRRLISILAMLVGALTGGVLFRWVTLDAPLWLAAVPLVRPCYGRLPGGPPPTIRRPGSNR